MARPLRIEFPGAVYHVTSRGNAGRPSLSRLFKEEDTKDRRDKIIHDAHVKYGYTLKEIADHLQIHYTTVSKVVALRDT